MANISVLFAEDEFEDKFGFLMEIVGLGLLLVPLVVVPLAVVASPLIAPIFLGDTTDADPVDINGGGIKIQISYF